MLKGKKLDNKESLSGSFKMALCELSGKKTRVKNLVSHSNIKTKSRAFANIQSKRFFSLQLKKAFQFQVSTHAIRHIDKLGGFDIFIMKQKDNLLSPRALKVKKEILKKTQKRGLNEAKN